MADATLLKYEAEAKGIRQVLEAKALGYQALVPSASNDARAAATLLLTEKLEHLVAMQVEAIKAIKIDKVTVWDAGDGRQRQWRSTTANFLAGMVKSLPPLHDVAAMAGLELPKFLGDAKCCAKLRRATAPRTATRSKWGQSPFARQMGTRLNRATSLLIGGDGALLGPFAQLGDFLAHAPRTRAWWRRSRRR